MSQRRGVPRGRIRHPPFVTDPHEIKRKHDDVDGCPRRELGFVHAAPGARCQVLEGPQATCGAVDTHHLRVQDQPPAPPTGVRVDYHPRSALGSPRTMFATSGKAAVLSSQFLENIFTAQSSPPPSEGATWI